MHNNKENSKPKDLKKSLSRLIKELNKYKLLIIISLILAVFGSILSIISPNKLSSLTDEITNGLMINKENFTSLNEQIYFNYTNNDLKEIEIDNIKISINDQLEYLNIAKDIKQDDVNDLYSKLDLMPESIRNLVKPKMNLNKIKDISIFLAVLYILSALFTYIESISMTVVANKFAKALRKKISIKINKLPLKYFDKNKIGDVLSRVTNDVDTVSQSLNNSLASFVSALTLFIGTIIMMFVTNTLMAITAIVSSLFGFIFMFIVLSKSQKYFTERQQELGNLNANIEEIYSNVSVVKSYNAKEETRDGFNKINEKLFNATRKSGFLSGLMPPMMMFIGNFGYVCVCIVGALLVINNKISFGVIIAFISYVRLFTSPLSQIAQTMSSFQQTAAASERVFELLDEEEMEEEKTKKVLLPENVLGKLEFKDVCFTYDGNSDATIKDFSAQIKPGQKVALVGPTGSGKTTMVNLLMKFYDINSGDIKIDDISIKDLKRENVHDLFTMVLQDTWLFDGTIKENIIYNRENVSLDDVKKACKTVGIDHFIKTLPEGYDSYLNDEASVSAGQRQLLTIARALIKETPFLILDEATSNVDTRTEELISKAMDILTKGKTSFIIAHRLSTIKNADLIIVMKDGKILEKGNHDELLKQNGFYAELYNSQFKL
ncbi:MAG: ABC transporter ATP-binding protein/permease [Tenericutes bacterium]|nr:ABC transporter ATP-binding protein/permease [Mycoplasmatota bacterium]